jgi:hypothetical protein
MTFFSRVMAVLSRVTGLLSRLADLVASIISVYLVLGLGLGLGLVSCTKTGQVRHEIEPQGYVHSTLKKHRSWIVSYREQVKVCESAEPCLGLERGVIVHTNGNNLLKLRGKSIVTVKYYPNGYTDAGMLKCRLWRCWG